MEKNQLYYGDNLTVLREHIKDESVDLIYLDPPFNSRQDYNVLFAERRACPKRSRRGRVSDAMRAFCTFLGHSDMMAYLATIALRPIELHRAFNHHPRNCHPERSGVSEAQPRGVEGPLHPLPQPDCIQTFSRSALRPKKHPHRKREQAEIGALISMRPPTHAQPRLPHLSRFSKGGYL
jgi:hypothetical protein